MEDKQFLSRRLDRCPNYSTDAPVQLKMHRDQYKLMVITRGKTIRYSHKKKIKSTSRIRAQYPYNCITF